VGNIKNILRNWNYFRGYEAAARRLPNSPLAPIITGGIKSRPLMGSQFDSPLAPIIMQMYGAQLRNSLLAPIIMPMYEAMGQRPLTPTITIMQKVWGIRLPLSGLIPL
jgi:hypothetical protein